MKMSTTYVLIQPPYKFTHIHSEKMSGIEGTSKLHTVSRKTRLLKIIRNYLWDHILNIL